MNLQPTTLIFSAELESLSDTENDLRSNRLINILNDLGIAFKTVMGCYKYKSGNITSEKSFIVPIADQALRESLTSLLLDKFGQESILELTPKRKAFLIGKESEKCLGDFKEVSKELAYKLGVFTYDQSTRKYYAVI